MAKLLPPLIEATIPAFYSEGTGMVSITIPFSMNRAVNQADVKGLSIKIKTVQSSSYLYSEQITDSAYFDVKSNSPNVILQIKGDTQDERDFLNRIKVGQYYKFQIAYIDVSGEVGYFSTVSVGKYTNRPEKIEILNTNNGINARAYHYTGLYKNLDITEKAYSYSFNLYDLSNELVYTTGELLHNSENDVNVGEQQDSFDLTMDLVVDQVYYLQYKVTTINNLTVYSKKVRIVQRETIEPEIETEVIAKLNSEDGYIEVSLNGETMTSGSFMLTRACSDSNFTIWDKVQLYRMINDIPKNISPFKDFTVEQGKTYQYSLVQYNASNLYSNRIVSNDRVYVDFEHAFLYDGKRQLKIKYNPKITSLKANVLETKIDTIGGQYPFVFRNGSVYYREFPISGLISLLSDENGLFYEMVAAIDHVREDTPASANFNAGSRSNLTAENFFNERNFKLEVLKWLTNGETKLFRSPGEGNFIVRLMNSSLSPNDQLSRLLHTFSCTAYEIADFTYDNLINYKLITLTEPESQVNTVMYWTTVNLSDVPIGEPINAENVVTASFTDMTPGDEIRLVLDNEVIDIVIGATGKYILEREVPIRSMHIIKMANSGYCTYSYYSTQANNFDIIQNISYDDIPAAQIIGPSDDIRADLGLLITNGDSHILNPKTSLIKIYYIKAIRREWTPVYYRNGNLYLSPFDTSIPLVKPNPALLYRQIHSKRIDDLNKNDFFKLNESGNKIALKDVEIASGGSLYDPIVGGADGNTVVVDAEDIYEDYNRWHQEGSTNFIPTRYYSYNPTLTLHYSDGDQVIDLSDVILGEKTDNGIKHYIHSPRYFYSDKLYDNYNLVTFTEDKPYEPNRYYVVVNGKYQLDSSLIQRSDETYYERIEISLDKITIGNGVILEIGYQTKNIDYTAESNNENLRDLKLEYEDKISNLTTYFSTGLIEDDIPNRDMYGELLKETQTLYNEIGAEMIELLN